MDGARWVQSRQHAILLCVWRCQRVLRRDLLFDDALLDEVLVGRVAQGDNSTGETVRVVLCLQLHLLLLVHLDCMQAVLVQVR